MLAPDHYLIVDDDLAASDWESELYRLGVPEGAEASFRSVGDARPELALLRDSGAVTVVITSSVVVMAELARGGMMSGDRVNLGGLHAAPGRRRVLDYLHLDERDRAAIRELEEEGVTVTARDLPGSPVVGRDRLLGGPPS